MRRAKAKSITATRAALSKATITGLYSKFEKAHAAMKAVPNRGTVVDNKAFGRAVEKCDRIARQIVYLPAVSIHEMLLKIRIAGWCHDSTLVGNRAFRPLLHKLEDLDHWQPNPRFPDAFEECAALVNIRADLRKLNTPAKLIELAKDLGITSDKSSSWRGR